MATTYKAVVNMAQKRRDGTYNVKIRVTHKRRSVKIATNVYLTDQQVTKKGRIKDQRIVDQCEDIIRNWRNKTNQLGMSADSLEIEDIVKYIQGPSGDGNSFIDFIAYGEKCIAGMLPSTGRTYAYALKMLRQFIESDKLDINRISYSFLVSFESYIRENLKKNNKTDSDNPRAVSSYLSCVRHLHNRAKLEYNDEERGIVLIPYSPFNRYKVPASPAPRKIAVDPQIIQAIIDLPNATKSQSAGKGMRRRDLARDCYLLSLGLAGMNAADLFGSNARLVGDVIVYNRQKTKSRREDKAEFRIRVEPCIMPLVKKYIETDGSHLFAFHRWHKNLDHFNVNICEGLKLVDRELKGNKDLKKILPEHIVFYSARHSWATIARSSKLNIDKYTVHEGLNHLDSRMSITDRYIDKDYTNIWNANAKVLGLFDWSAIKKNRGRPKASPRYSSISAK